MMRFRNLQALGIWENFPPARMSFNLTRSAHASTPPSKANNEELNTAVPDKPKRPANAYLRFSSKMLPEFKKMYPEKTHKDIVKDMAKVWSTMEDAEKQKYVKEYENEMLTYKRKVEQALSMIKSVPQKPKRSPTAYVLYCSARMSERPANILQKDWVRQIGKDWRNLSIEQISAFENRAMQLRVEYEAEMDEWRKKMQNEADKFTVPNQKGRAGNA